jgi:hypothetical protein
MGDDVATYLAANGIGTKGATIFVGNPPAQKNDFVLITDTGGAKPDQDYAINHPSVQVAVYGSANSYTASFALLQSIFVLLNRKQNLTIGTKNVMFVQAISSPQVIGLDPEKNRWLMTCNFTFKIRSAEGS